MHPSVIRDRLIVAGQDITKSSTELAELLGIDGLKPIPADARDENERIMHRLESVAEFLKRAVVAADQEEDVSATLTVERETVVGDTPPVEIDDPAVETPEVVEDPAVPAVEEPEVVEETPEVEETEEDGEEEDEEETEVDNLATLTVAAKTALYNAGIRTFDDVRVMSDEDLLSIVGIGQKTVEALREATK